MSMDSVQLDPVFLRDLKKLTGGEDRGSYYDALTKIVAARRDLSSTDMRRCFNNAVKRHGRAAVGICVAATLHRRGERIGFWGYDWAQAVHDALPERLQGAAYLCGCIDDGIPDTAICQCAAELAIAY